MDGHRIRWFARVTPSDEYPDGPAARSVHAWQGLGLGCSLLVRLGVAHWRRDPAADPRSYR